MHLEIFSNYIQIAAIMNVIDSNINYHYAIESFKINVTFILANLVIIYSS